MLDFGQEQSIKVPIAGMQDWHYLCGLYEAVAGYFPKVKWYVQPVNSEYQPDDVPDVGKLLRQTRQLADWVLDPSAGHMRLNVLPQYHVLMWGNERGR